MSRIIVDELVAQVSAQVDNSSFLGAKKSFSAFGTAIKVAAGAVAALFTGELARAVIESSEAADALVKASDAAGVAFGSFQKLGYAAELAGIAQSDYNSSMVNFQKIIGEVERGTGRAKKVLEDYGVSVRGANGEILGADELLLNVADKFKELNKSQKVDLAKKLGLSDNFIVLLNSGRDAIEALGAEAENLGLIIPEEQARNAEAFNDRLATIKLQLTRLRDSILLPIIPKIKELADQFSNFLGENRVSILKAITVAFGIMKVAIKAASDSLYLIILPFKILYQIWERLPNSAKTIIKWIAAIRIEYLAIDKIVKMSTLGKITLAIIAISSVIEDFIVWLNGGKSAFEYFYKSIFGDAESLKNNLAIIWDDLKETTENVLGFMAYLWENWQLSNASVIDAVMKYWNKFVALLNSAGAWAKGVSDSLIASFASFFSWIGDKIDAVMRKWENFKKAASSPWDWATGQGEFDTKGADGLPKVTIPALDFPATLQNGLSAVGDVTNKNYAVNSSKTVAQSVTINVNGAQDARGVTREIEKFFKAQTDSAIMNSNVGIA